MECLGRSSRAQGSWNSLLLIQTHANQERTAEAALTAPRRQCSVYFPKILTRRSHARRVELVERPFIQRYGFVDGDWRTARTAPGVSHVVASGDEVRRAADEIRSREVKGYVQLDDELQEGFHSGDAVYVTTLAAKGMFAVKHGLDRAFVLLEMLGSKRIVEVSLSVLEAA